MHRILGLVALLLLAVGAEAQDFIKYTPAPVAGTSGGGATFTAPVLLPDGTEGAPALAFSGAPTVGWYRPAAGYWALSNGTTTQLVYRSGVGLILADAIPYGWANGASAYSGTMDTKLFRDGAANTIAQRNVNADQLWRHYGANGGYWERGVNSELLTIAAAATTDTTGNLLPASAVIEAVVVRVTTIIPTAATFTVGDATTAARFATGVAVAADTTAVGLLHRHPDVAAAAGPVQATAAKVRITPSSSPGAATGVVRIEVFFSRFVPPTS